MNSYDIKVCKSKVRYHNEKSAKRAVEAFSHGYKTEFEYYKCGESKHFHITHKNKSERIGHGNKQRVR